MLKNHPKGLLVAFFSNMGERFGFYTMMAILVLFLQAKYGLSAEKAGDIYSWFYFSIYALALVGGILADVTRKYKTVILFGIIIMLSADGSTKYATHIHHHCALHDSLREWPFQGQSSGSCRPDV
jgi:dipeptide/tripeptide permease